MNYWIRCRRVKDMSGEPLEGSEQIPCSICEEPVWATETTRMAIQFLTFRPICEQCLEEKSKNETLVGREDPITDRELDFLRREDKAPLN